MSWRSKNQGCVVLSTAEAEYVALVSAAQESIWLRKFIAQLVLLKGQEQFLKTTSLNYHE